MKIRALWWLVKKTGVGLVSLLQCKRLRGITLCAFTLQLDCCVLAEVNSVALLERGTLAVRGKIIPTASSGNDITITIFLNVIFNYSRLEKTVYTLFPDSFYVFRFYRVSQVLPPAR
jgi:hypothetical protein